MKNYIFMEKTSGLYFSGGIYKEGLVKDKEDAKVFCFDSLVYANMFSTGLNHKSQSCDKKDLSLGIIPDYLIFIPLEL